MIRRLLVFLTILSLLPAAAVAALWLRSGGDGDQFIFTTRGRFWWVESGRGGFEVHTVAGWPSRERWRWVTQNTNDQIPTITFVDPWTKWRRFGVGGQHGLVKTWLDADGAPARLSAYLVEAPRGGPGRDSAPMRHASVRLPHWMALVAFGALPLSHAALALRRRMRRRRLAARRRCPDCGYDLRATPGRCPECGGGVPPRP